MLLFGLFWFILGNPFLFLEPHIEVAIKEVKVLIEVHIEINIEINIEIIIEINIEIESKTKIVVEKN